ncbi:hypothetical protein [uncultured Clostridium sp.]|jgi:hypothetical protein|uniref:hypothetical protein n=1 Tax=uncultured Clostridium sp. TaxID=59620 RepID=UPI0025CF7B79|nr:hypothetical protein [uncultured Clostridium sp.]
MIIKGKEVTLIKIFRRLKNRIVDTPKNSIIKLSINIIYPILFYLKRDEILQLNDISNDIQNNVIVSLTSIPSRIGTLHYVIKSLLIQTYKPNKIILWLAKEDFSENIILPKELLKLVGNRFEIKWCENIKPHKKYFYTMKENYDSIIITVDDDGFYRRNLIKDLMNSYKKYPNYISCTRAHKMVFKNKQIIEYNQWDYETKEFNKPSNHIFATGVGGVLYPPKCFDNRAFNKEEIYKLCLNADDVWLKAMEILNGRLVVAIPSTKTKYVVGIYNSEKFHLSKNNVLNSNNDKYIKNVFEKYNINYSYFEEDYS